MTALPYGQSAEARWDARVLGYLVGPLSIGDHGQTAESIAGHWPAPPVAEVQAALDRLEAAGLTWKDGVGYRRADMSAVLQWQQSRDTSVVNAR